ncbi:MAG: hypothetical protein HY812_04585, partial [Planctomycetes bacterium]|nr:hypothetical protein [Planctomycetota bacterium]
MSKVRFVVLALLPSYAFSLGEGAAAADVLQSAETTALGGWTDLASPWYEVRRSTERRLNNLDPEDGRRLAEALLAEAAPDLRRAGA